MKVKTYSMNNMSHRDIMNVVRMINALGYGPSDYRVVYFGSHKAELKVVNKDLHWFLKSASRLARSKGA